MLLSYYILLEQHKNTNHKHEITNMNKTSNNPSCLLVADWNECSVKINVYNINNEVDQRVQLLTLFFLLDSCFQEQIKNNLKKKKLKC